MKKGIVLALTACLAAPSIADNYAELSLGVTKLYSFDKDTNDWIKDFDASPAVKVLTGGRLNQSATIWYELGASHDGAMTNEATTITNLSAFTGLKFTTNPAANSHLYLKTGIGRLWSNWKTEGENDEKNEKHNTAYLSLGTGLRLTPDNALMFEIQHITDIESERGTNGLFVSYNTGF